MLIRRISILVVNESLLVANLNKMAANLVSNTNVKIQFKNLFSKSLEDDLKVKRDELGVLREEELDMETKFEGSHRRLVQLTKLQNASQTQISQVGLHISLIHQKLACVY